jgi:hypothetical protein
MEDIIRKELERITPKEDMELDIYPATENIAFVRANEWGFVREYLIEDKTFFLNLIATRCSEDDTDDWEFVNQNLHDWVTEWIK